MPWSALCCFFREHDSVLGKTKPAIQNESKRLYRWCCIWISKYFAIVWKITACPMRWESPRCQKNYSIHPVRIKVANFSPFDMWHTFVNNMWHIFVNNCNWRKDISFWTKPCSAFTFTFHCVEFLCLFWRLIIDLINKNSKLTK